MASQVGAESHPGSDGVREGHGVYLPFGRGGLRCAGNAGRGSTSIRRIGICSVDRHDQPISGREWRAILVDCPRAAPRVPRLEDQPSQVPASHRTGRAGPIRCQCSSGACLLAGRRHVDRVFLCMGCDTHGSGAAGRPVSWGWQAFRHGATCFIARAVCDRGIFQLLVTIPLPCGGEPAPAAFYRAWDRPGRSGGVRYRATRRL